MKLVPNGEVLLQMAGLPNSHQLSLRARISYPTVDKYINAPETTSSISALVMAAILLDGLDLTPDQVLELRLGDVFQLVE